MKFKFHILREQLGWNGGFSFILSLIIAYKVARKLEEAKQFIIFPNFDASTTPED